MRATTWSRRAWGLALACAVGLWMAADRSGAEERPESPDDVGDESAAPAGTARLGDIEIAVDPETGRLVPPSAEQARAMARELRRILAAPAARAAGHIREVPRAAAPEGTRGVVVAPGVVQWTVARIGPDGARHAACVHGVEGVERHLASEPAEDGERRGER